MRRILRGLRVLLFVLGIGGACGSGWMWWRSHHVVDVFQWFSTPERSPTAATRYHLGYKSVMGRLQLSLCHGRMAALPGTTLPSKYAYVTWPDDEKYYTRHFTDPSDFTYDSYLIRTPGPAHGLYFRHFADPHPYRDMDPVTKRIFVACNNTNQEWLLSLPYWGLLTLS
jgi:hypothetical protein